MKVKKCVYPKLIHTSSGEEILGKELLVMKKNQVTTFSWDTAEARHL